MVEEAGTTTKEKSRPLLKWVGGKTRLLPELRTRLPIGWHELLYVEPFCGSAALFFDLKPKRALLSDSNRSLIRTLRSVQDRPEDLCKTLAEFEREHSKEFYYETRELFNKGLGESSFNAAAFIYLNRTCFNGLWRTNKDGHFNVPIGSYANPKMPTVETIMAASKTLQAAQIVCWDYYQICSELSPDSFVYFDPPYDPISSTSNFTNYTAEGFDARMQTHLARIFAPLSDRGCKLMLSNSDTAFTRELYSNWVIDTVSVRRSISAGQRGSVNEIIVRNYGVPNASSL